MAGSTFIQVPPNLEDIQSLRRFLDKLVQQLDVAFGNRGTTSFSTNSSLAEVIAEVVRLNDELDNYARLDGSNSFTAITSYTSEFTVTLPTDIIYKGYADTTFSHIDGSIPYTGIISYDAAKTFTLPNQLISKSYVDANFTYNPAQLNIANLSLTPSATYVSAELKSVADKVDSILASLRLSNLLG